MIYREFLKTNPKNIEARKKFICINCDKVKNTISIWAELGRDRRQVDPATNDGETTEESIISNISLKGLRKLIKDSNLWDSYCERCNLCFKKEFIKKRKFLKKLVEDLNKSKGTFINKKLEEVCKSYLQVSLNLEKRQEEKYGLKIETNNLYQYIIFDYVKPFLEKIYNNGNVKEYFLQISKILLTTNKFIKDIEEIRNKYMVEKSFGNTIPDYYRKPDFTHEDIHQEIEKILIKYLLSTRWKSWAYNILIHNIDKRKKLLNTFIPDDSIMGIRKFQRHEDRVEMVVEPTIVGDETNRQLEQFGLNREGRPNSRNKRKPILEFDKYLRWYKASEAGRSYRDIFDDELVNHFEDWRDFKEYRDGNTVVIRTLSDGRTRGQWERRAKNRIKYGVLKLKNKIFEEYK